MLLYPALSQFNIHLKMKKFIRSLFKIFFSSFRYIAPAVLSLIYFFQVSAQTNYYYKGSGAINTNTNWTTSSSGSGGSSPVNFTTANQIFNLGNTTTLSFTLTLSSAWTISGSGSQLIIPNGTTLTSAAVLITPTLTIQNGGSVQSNAAITVSAAFNINNGGTYIHNNTGTISSTIFAGTESFGVTSIFRINNWQNTSTSVTSNITASASAGGNSYYYGNLEIGWASGGTWNLGWGSTNLYLTASDFSLLSSFTGTFLFTSSNTEPFVYVNGNFVMAATSGTIDFCSANGNNRPRLYVNGDITHSSGTITTSGNNAYGTIYTYGSTAPAWIFSGGTRTYMAYYITSGKTVNLGSNFNLNSAPTILNDLTIGGTLNAGNYIISYAYNGATSAYIVISSTGKITTTNLNGLTGSASATVNPTNTVNTYLQTGSTVEYKASGGIQNITTPSNANYLYDPANANLPNYENLIISGTGTKQISSATTVNKVLTLSGGSSGSANLLNIGNNVLTIAGTGSISGYDNYNYVTTGSNSGRLRQNSLAASAARVFPVGTASCYMPATVTPTAASFNYSVNVFTGVTTNGLYNGTAWSAAQKKGMVDAVWNVERSTIATVADIVSFQWDNCYGSLEGTDFSAAANSNIGIWYWASGINWSLAAAGFTNNNSNAGGFNTSANTGTFRYSSTSGGNTHYIVAISNTALAVSAVKLTGQMNENEVLLNWTAETSGATVKSFEIERSFNNTDFTKISSLLFTDKPAYSFTDKIAGAGLEYYRIKMIYADGKIVYSNTVAVNTGRGKEIKLLGNPVFTEAVLLHPPSVNGRCAIISLDGKTVLNSNISSGASISKINVSSLPGGVYILQYADDNMFKSLKFIKQ